MLVCHGGTTWSRTFFIASKQVFEQPPFGAVSYTHLDVYKRQELGRSLKLPPQYEAHRKEIEAVLPALG